MAVKVEKLPRVFRYSSMDLRDISAAMTPQEIRDVYAASYPELATAEVIGPEKKDGRLVWTFNRAVGTKGATRFERCIGEDGCAYVQPVPAIGDTTPKTFGDMLEALAEAIDAAFLKLLGLTPVEIAARKRGPH